MKVSELGEFGLVDLLAKVAYEVQDRQAAPWQQLLVGIGDDAAAWHSDASIELATVDSLIQGTHFTLDTTTWHELGWKALAVGLSDIAAMGGIPKYALVSLGLPGHTEVDDVTDLYMEMMELGQAFGVAIVGGDTSSSPLVILNTTVLGSTSGQAQKILTRSAARAGDRIAVTGYMGGAAAGLEVLTKQFQFDLEATASLKRAFLRPYPRIAEGQLLVEQGVKTAIDISDGLISDLTHICKASRVSARIEVDRVPTLPAVKANFGDKWLELALSGGEDYELLFTGSAGTIDGVKRAVSYPVTVIGEIVADKLGEITLVDSKGNPFSLRKAGWEHFTG